MAKTATTKTAKMTREGLDAAEEAAIVAQLAPLGIRESTARKLLEPDFAGRIGYPDYRLTNLGSEARRLEKRIKALDDQASAPAREPKTFASPDGQIEVREEENRVRIVFPCKPSEAIRARLKSNGFRWSPSANAWQRHAGAYAWQIAATIAEACSTPAQDDEIEEEPCSCPGECKGCSGGMLKRDCPCIDDRKAG